MATLKDLAERTGLSPSTISYVLNGKKRVKAETFEKIMNAVNELGYRPNQIARSLKTRNTMTIGVIVPDISNEFFPEIIKGIDEKAQSLGYNIILCSSNNDSQKEEDSIATLLSKNIDGLILIGTARSSTILNQKISIPVVLVDRILDVEYSSVTTDNFKGGYMATEFLAKSGCDKIALLCGSISVNTVSDRIRGYNKALKDNSLPYNDSYVVNCDFTITGGYNAVETLIQKGINFNGIFATNDLIAIGAMRCLSKHNYKIPDDVAIIGYDDISVASMLTPSLSTVCQPKYLMGSHAAELLITMISNKHSDLQHIVLSPSIITRDSTPPTP